jgi:ribosomal protein S18 acetylase RimI-like enzyme
MDSENENLDSYPGRRSILLQDKNMKIYGFTRFFYPEERTDNKPGWLRPVRGIEAELSPQSITDIIVPDELLIPLSRDPEEKLFRWKNFIVEEVGDQVSSMKILSKRAGWNQTDQDLKAVIQFAEQMNFLAQIRIKNKVIPLGSGAILDIGDDIFWIGMILVHPEVRRQGIALAIMIHCLKEARMKNKRSIIGLDATPDGLKLYRLLGFYKSLEINRCLLVVDTEIPVESNKRIEKFNQFEDIQDYLLERGFDDRHRLYRGLVRLSSGRCFLTRSENRVTGFVLSRPGAMFPYIGPLIADEDTDAGILIREVLKSWKDNNQENVLIDVPSHHFTILSGDRQATTEAMPIWPVLLSKMNILRKFSRMYHLISEENKDSFANFLIKHDSHRYQRNDFMNMLNNSAMNYEKTKSYLDKEKNQLINYQYAIGGPEFS